MLHVSGLQYTIDPSKSAFVPDVNDEGNAIGCMQDGNRIVNVNVEQQDKQFYPISENCEYDIIVNSMMIDDSLQRAQFYMFKSIKDKHNTGLTEKGVLMKYFAQHANCPTLGANKSDC